MTRLMPHAAFAVLVVLLASAGPLRAADFDIPLAVHENAGLARYGEPVSGGVPFPMGVLKDAAGVKLVDADGNDMPAQFSAINHWGHDGSIQWLLVQSIATAPASGKASFRLVPGPAAAAGTTLKVTETDDRITVETGSICFAIGKKQFGLLNVGSPYVQKVLTPGCRSTLTLANGEQYSSAAGEPTKVVIEERGPLRATILVRGLHRPAAEGKSTLPYLYGYIVRIRAYAGQPYVDLSFTLTDGEQPPIGMPLCKDWQIVFPMAMKASKPATGANWVAGGDGPLGVHADVRYLKENAPAKLAIEPAGDGAAVVLRPWAGGEQFLDVCSRKTYEMRLTLGAPEAIVRDGEAISKPHASALRFWFPPAWASRTRAWGDFGYVAVPDEAMAKAITRRFTPFSMDGYIKGRMKGDVEQEAWRYYGADPEMESGSSGAPGGGYEPLLKTAHFYLTYLQTADPRFYDQLERTSWFWRDRFMIYIDMDFRQKHYPGGGGVYRLYYNRGLADFAGVQTPRAGRYSGCWNYGGPWGPMDTQHFSVDEVVNYYYLTGDRACLDALDMYGQEATSFVNEWLAAEAKTSKATISRAHGWVTRALVSCYEATNDPQLLETARRAVASICRNQDKTAGTIYDVNEGQTPFMAAAVGMSLGRFYRHYPEEAVRDAILGIADWLYYDVAIPAKGFSYHWSKDDPSGWSVSGHRCMSTMSWAYLATGKQQYMDAADLHAGLAPGMTDAQRRNILAYWQVNGFGQEYVTLKSTKRADAVPPAAVTDLAAEALGGGAVKLTWTAPGDDGSNGKAAEYQVKWAAVPIKERSDWRNHPDSEVSFWAATNVAGEPTPSAAGAAEQLVVKDLKPGTYYFALKSYDEQPNQSGLGNVVKVEVR